MMDGMAKRSAAMVRNGSMPAPDFVGLGHGTQRREPNGFMQPRKPLLRLDFRSV